MQFSSSLLGRASFRPLPAAARRWSSSSSNSSNSSSSKIWRTPGAQHENSSGAAPTALEQQPEQQQPVVGNGSSWQQRALADPPMLGVFAGVLLQTGAVLGTLLDGIHSRTGLQVYDVAPLHIGPLATSALVPPLLGTFYLVLGLATCVADNLAAPADGATVTARRRSESDLWVALSFGALAAALQASAWLYESGAPAVQLLGVLAAVSAANWAVFDGTRQGLALAAVCAVGAPAAELVLMAATHCWHYSRPDLAGVFVSWVPLCYFFYVPAVSNLSRYLWATCRLPEGYEGSGSGSGGGGGNGSEGSASSPDQQQQQ